MVCEWIETSNSVIATIASRRNSQTPLNHCQRVALPPEKRRIEKGVEENVLEIGVKKQKKRRIRHEGEGKGGLTAEATGQATFVSSV